MTLAAKKVKAIFFFMKVIALSLIINPENGGSPPAFIIPQKKFFVLVFKNQTIGIRIEK